MWASCLPTEGFSGPQGAVLEQSRAGQGSLARYTCGLRRHRPPGRRVADPERLARSPELQDADALKAGEGLMIQGLELGADRAR